MLLFPLPTLCIDQSASLEVKQQCSNVLVSVTDEVTCDPFVCPVMLCSSLPLLTGLSPRRPVSVTGIQGHSSHSFEDSIHNCSLIVTCGSVMSENHLSLERSPQTATDESVGALRLSDNSWLQGSLAGGPNTETKLGLGPPTDWTVWQLLYLCVFGHGALPFYIPTQRRAGSGQQ